MGPCAGMESVGRNGTWVPLSLKVTSDRVPKCPGRIHIHALNPSGDGTPPAPRDACGSGGWYEPSYSLFPKTYLFCLFSPKSSHLGPRHSSLGKFLTSYFSSLL